MFAIESASLCMHFDSFTLPSPSVLWPPTTYDEEHTLWNSWCNLLHFRVNHSLLDLTALLSTSFWNDMRHSSFSQRRCCVFKSSGILSPTVYDFSRRDKIWSASLIRSSSPYVRIKYASSIRSQRYTGCDGVGAEKFHSLYVQTAISDVCIWLDTKATLHYHTAPEQDFRRTLDWIWRPSQLACTITWP